MAYYRMAVVSKSKLFKQLQFSPISIPIYRFSNESQSDPVENQDSTDPSDQLVNQRLDDTKKALLGIPKKGIDYNEDMFVHLIYDYSKSNRKWDTVKNCVKVYLKMEELGVVKTIKLYNSLLDVFISHRKYAMAEKYFNRMLSEGIVPVQHTYTLMIKGYVKVNKMEEAEKLLTEMKRREIAPLLVSYNSMINGYAKVKKMEDAERVLAEMMAREVEPNLVTYNSLINGYVSVERMDDARKLVVEMKARNVEPDLVTYVTMVKGYVRVNRVDDGVELVEEMKRKEFGRKVDVNLCLGILKEGCDDEKMCEAQRSVLRGVEEYVERVDLLALRDAAREFSELASKQVAGKRDSVVTVAF
ncbi:uncharacterized protein LOC143539990 [Bidens hawaiensis]|uniref:uncharacterized protein LOC143539990 n=1 Tax=Bidens hawaiensis TaxID=980011 RepID=UPI00404ABC22